MKTGYIVYFRKRHSVWETIFLEDQKPGTVFEIEYTRCTESMMHIDYGGGRERRYRAKSDFYEFHKTKSSAFYALAMYYENLAKYKITESEDFKRQAAELREKSKHLKEIAKNAVA